MGVRYVALGCAQASVELKPFFSGGGLSQVSKRPLTGSVSDVVVSFDFPPQIGGAHLWLYEVYRRWGSEVSLLTHQYSSVPAEAEEQREFDRGRHGSLRIYREARRLRSIDLLNPSCLRGFWSQATAIGKFSGRDSAKATRVHALKAFPEGFAALLYKSLHPRSCRMIIYAHGEEILVAQKSLQLRLIAKRVYSAADLVIANSENTRQIVNEFCPAARVVCIHPGVDAATFERDENAGAAFRASWGWPPATVVVCTVARMEARKNHAAVIHAIGQLRRERLQVAYVCGGDGPERERLERLVTDAGLGRWVVFLGRLSERDKRNLYSAADIYAMPAVQVGEMVEGFGIVFLEAAASGLPSICGSSGGQAEAVRHGCTGFVVDGSNSQAVASCIAGLSRDPALRTTMGNAGREWAIQHDWSKVVRNTRFEMDRLHDRLSEAGS